MDRRPESWLRNTEAVLTVAVIVVIAVVVLRDATTWPDELACGGWRRLGMAKNGPHCHDAGVPVDDMLIRHEEDSTCVLAHGPHHQEAGT